jgi:excisionase family DNA binding protein
MSGVCDVPSILPTPSAPELVWLTVPEAAARARVSRRIIYAEVRAGRLRAARVGGRRSLRFRPAWVDEFLDQSARAATPIEIVRRRP